MKVFVLLYSDCVKKIDLVSSKGQETLKCLNCLQLF